MAFNAGKITRFFLTNVPIKQDKVRIKIGGELVDVSNSEDGVGQYLIDGCTINEVEVSGPVDQGNLSIVKGTQYTAKIRFGGVLDYTAVVRCESMEVTDERKDTARYTAVFKSSDGSNFITGWA